MRYSKLLGKPHPSIKTRGLFPGGDTLQQAGYVQVIGKGLVGWLPMGELVLRNLRKLLDQEMEVIGGQAASWPVLSANKPKVKVESGEDDAVAIEFIRPHLSSYKELPIYMYQFSKQRNSTELLPGNYRGSEILTQKGFTIHASFSSLNNFLPRLHTAFSRVFKECNQSVLMIRDSHGPVDPEKRYSTSLLVLPLAQRGNCQFSSCSVCNYIQLIDSRLDRNLLRVVKDEVGRRCFCRICHHELEICNGYILARVDRASHAALARFYLQRGTRLLQPLAARSEFYLTPCVFFAAANSMKEKGLLWPRSLAPFRAMVMGIGSSSTARRFAERILSEEAKLLLDDRHISISRKMKDFYSLGLPQAVVVSAPKLLQGHVDIIDRRSETTYTIDKGKVGEFLTG